MANRIVTYVDAAVLIYAAKKPTAGTFTRRLRALQILTDPNREFVSSEFLRLEVLPIPNYFKKSNEIAFYQAFFNGVSHWVTDSQLLNSAYQLASQYGLGALDALHISAAISVNAEFISAEKPTKPMYRVAANISTIY